MDLEQQNMATTKFWRCRAALVVSALCAVLLVANMIFLAQEESTFLSKLSRNTETDSSHRSLLFSASNLRVFYDATSESSSTTLSRRMQIELKSDADTSKLEPVPLDVHKPPSFVRDCPGASERMQSLLKLGQDHLALEVLKYCGFVTSRGTGLYIDSGASVLMDTLDHVLQVVGGGRSNIAVLNDPFMASSIHGAMLYLNPNHASKNLAVAQAMLEILISTKVEILLSNPTLLPKSLYDLVATDAGMSQLTAGQDERWYLLQHSCTIDPLGGRQVTAPISSFALQSYR